VRAAGGVLLLLSVLVSGCSLAGDITPPPALATAQAAETLPPATVAPTGTKETTPSATGAPAEPGTIRGAVTNGTPGGAVPAGAEVLLSGFDEKQETYRQSAAVADDGTFVFTGVPAVEGRIYGVTVTYGNVLYYSDGTTLTEDSQAADLPVTVYETTSASEALSIERLHVLFDFTVANQVQVIELWILSNSGDRTIVAEPSGAVVEVSIPEGAVDLAFENGAVGDRYIQTLDGFGDREPVIPGTGTSQFIFSYWLPYDGSLTLERPSDYPVKAVVVLIPQSGVKAQGAGLQDLGLKDVGGQAVQTYEGGGIPAGQSLEIELTGKPGGEAAKAGGGWTDIAVGVGALAGLLIAAGLWWSRARARPSRSRPTTESLINAVARLDDDLDAGRIGVDEHRRRREALKQQLRQRMG
jgi:hypothetical protein